MRVWKRVEHPEVDGQIGVGTLFYRDGTRCVGLTLPQDPCPMTTSEARMVAASLLDLADRIDDEGESS